MDVELISKAVPFFFLSIGIEAALDIITKRKYYRLNDSLNDLSCGISQQIFEIFAKVLVIGAYIWIYKNYSLFNISLDSPFAWVICFILVDFGYYWFHRASHEVSFIWGSHIPHHQSEEYNLTVALRQGTFENVFSSFFYLPIALLGFNPVMFIACHQIDTIYQFWVHTRFVKRIGFLENILNTPSHHRVHHGKNPIYIDKNYGGFFIIWDKLFGTYQEETEEVVYGTVKPLNSFNPIWANIHYWIDLVNKSRSAKGFNKIRVFYKGPGWNPDDPNNDFEIPHVDVATFKRYDPKVPLWLNIYILLQFLPMTAISTYFLENNQKFNNNEKILITSYIFLSLINIGALLENKKWAYILEIIRIELFIIILVPSI
jgi:alkylglycerol monooxygenase